MKRVIASALILLLLASMITASASTAGTRDEPLITLSYLNGAFASSLNDEASKTYGNAVDIATAKLGEIYRKYTGYRFASRFLFVSLSNGGVITLYAGSSFILLSGSAALSISKGTVVDISTGSEVSTGATLVQYHRYFCTESTTAFIKSTSVSTGQVDGYYTMTGGGYAKTHPVFKDVLESDWYYDAVCYVYDNRLFKGTSDDTYSPDLVMTRAMFVTVLHRLDGDGPETPAAGSQSAAQGQGSGGGINNGPDAGGVSQYTDVPAGWWYTEAVLWATVNGMITGYDDKTFGPDDALTREQMAVIIYRYAAYKGLNTASGGGSLDMFPDRGDASEYALPAMRWVVAHGVINGSDGKLIPRSSATRAQVAQIFWNFCQISG